MSLKNRPRYRTMNRANFRRALTRIEEDLQVLLVECPHYDNQIVVTIARESIHNVLEALKALYAPSKPSTIPETERMLCNQPQNN